MAYRFEYRASFWQDYSAALAYIAGSLKNPIAARELDEDKPPLPKGGQGRTHAARAAGWTGVLPSP